MGRFAEEKLADLVHIGTILLNPIMAGNAAIEIAVLDVAADLLGADQADNELVIIDVGNVRAAADLDVPSGLGHLLNGCVLQAAFGQAEFQFSITQSSLTQFCLRAASGTIPTFGTNP